jgi:hypothetical protein
MPTVGHRRILDFRHILAYIRRVTSSLLLHHRKRLPSVAKECPMESNRDHRMLVYWTEQRLVYLSLSRNDCVYLSKYFSARSLLGVR